VAKHFFGRIAVPPLKCHIYVQEPSFLQSRDGEGNRAGTKDFLAARGKAQDQQVLALEVDFLCPSLHLGLGGTQHSLPVYS
jgi:hypothetical protein